MNKKSSDVSHKYYTAVVLGRILDVDKPLQINEVVLTHLNYYVLVHPHNYMLL